MNKQIWIIALIMFLSACMSVEKGKGVVKTLKEMDSLIGEYYLENGKKYENNFINFANDNGFDYDLFVDDLNGDADDSFIVEFDNNFPIKKEILNDKYSKFDNGALIYKILQNIYNELDPLDGMQKKFEYNKKEYIGFNNKEPFKVLTPYHCSYHDNLFQLDDDKLFQLLEEKEEEKGQAPKEIGDLISNNHCCNKRVLVSIIKTLTKSCADEKEEIVLRAIREILDNGADSSFKIEDDYYFGNNYLNFLEGNDSIKIWEKIWNKFSNIEKNEKEILKSQILPKLKNAIYNGPGDIYALNFIYLCKILQYFEVSNRFNIYEKIKNSEDIVIFEQDRFNILRSISFKFPKKKFIILILTNF